MAFVVMNFLMTLLVAISNGAVYSIGCVMTYVNDRPNRLKAAATTIEFKSIFRSALYTVPLSVLFGLGWWLCQ